MGADHLFYQWHRKALAFPVGALAIMVMIMETPMCAVWSFCVFVTRKAGSGLPADLTRLRLPHWYLGRLWEHLWRGRSLWR